MNSADADQADATLAEFSGVLTTNAQLRHLVVGTDGTAVPCIEFDVQTDSRLQLPLHVRQCFRADQHLAAQAAARRYRKGLRVTVQAPVLGLQLTVPNATHIHTVNPEDS